MLKTRISPVSAKAARLIRTSAWKLSFTVLVVLGAGVVELNGQELSAPPPLVAAEFQRARSPIRPTQFDAVQLQHVQVGQIPGAPSQVVERPLPPQIVSMPTVQQKLEVVHHRSQLLVTRSRVRRIDIADPSVAEAVMFSPNEISIIGLVMGSTTMTLWFEGSSEPLIYLVTTVRDPSLGEQRKLDYQKLERKLALLFPNSKVFLIPLSWKIVVKGQARDTEEAAQILQIVRGEVINQYGNVYAGQNGSGSSATAVAVTNAAPGINAAYTDDIYSSYIVNMLEVPGERQVMLRVRIAELNRSQLRRFGIDFNYLFNNGAHAVGYSLGGLPSTLTGIFENGEISVLMNLLASNGTAKILSEPVLTVLSGHSASFLSGGEFAVPTIVGIGGAQGQTTTFRGFGTSIIATPTIIDKDLIRMQIVPEFSQLNTGNAVNGIPGLDTRRVQTTIELREGQTIAIAGLIAHRSNTEVTRIPFFGRIPYIGSRLLSSKRASQDETELLILVTPEIVRPMDADEVPPVPGHEVTLPTDTELFHYEMTEGAPDTGVYQLPPYGRGSGYGHNVGYRLFDPAPAGAEYVPEATAPFGRPNSFLPQQPVQQIYQQPIQQIYQQPAHQNYRQQIYRQQRQQSGLPQRQAVTGPAYPNQLNLSTPGPSILPSSMPPVPNSSLYQPPGTATGSVLNPDQQQPLFQQNNNPRRSWARRLLPRFPGVVTQ